MLHAQPGVPVKAHVFLRAPEPADQEQRKFVAGGAADFLTIILRV